MNNTLKTVIWAGLAYYAITKLPELDKKHILEATKEVSRDVSETGNSGKEYYQKFKDFLNSKSMTDKQNKTVVIVEPCPSDLKKLKIEKIYY